MKVLVIGTGSSPFVKEPIQFALADGENNIYVTYNEQKDKAYLDFYNENNINVINTHDRKNILGRVPKLGVLYNIWIAVRREMKTGKFNLIHIHSMNNYIMLLFIIRVLSKYSDRVICTFYGSDLLRKTDKQLKKMEKFFSKIDVFSMATDNLIDRFKEIYGDKYNNKIRKVPFGLSNLYFLDNLDKNKDYKRIFGINKNRIVISIGHNTCVEQQHISVLKEIASLSAEMKNKIAIILQLTYGNGTENYIKNVEEEANKIGCPIVVLRKYMSGDEIASMVSATDIYINSQQSDAISGAMLEYLYGGAAVINPKWIDYTELKKAGCDFIQYDSFDDIPIIIEQIIAGQISCDFQENYLAVKKISHWDVNKNKWRALFEGGQ